MSIKVTIMPQARENMEAHAIQTFPEECCGFMYGNEDGERVITNVKPANNVKGENRERRFEIDPLDYLKAEKYAESSGQRLLGIYHSHPKHPAIPSEHDRKQAVGYFSYVIISVNEERNIDHIRSWQLDDSYQFIEETIESKKVIN